MSRAFGIIFVALLALAQAAPVSAATITFTDVFDPANVTFTGNGAGCTMTSSAGSVSGCTLAWTHVLSGFDPSLHALADATFTMWLYDNGDNSAEKYDLALDSLTNTNITVTSGSTAVSPFTFSANVLSEVADGQLQVALTHSVNSFVFDRGTLAATWRERGSSDVSPIPEPATASLMLLGTALAATAVRRRRG